MNALIPAREVDDMTRAAIAGDNYALLLIVMYTALVAAATSTSCTFADTGYETASIKLQNDLRALGYDVSKSGANITITWGKRTEPSLISY